MYDKTQVCGNHSFCRKRWFFAYLNGRTGELSFNQLSIIRFVLLTRPRGSSSTCY